MSDTVINIKAGPGVEKAKQDFIGLRKSVEDLEKLNTKTSGKGSLSPKTFDQVTAAVKRFDAQQKVSKKVSEEWGKELDRLNAKLGKLKLSGETYIRTRKKIDELTPRKNNVDSLRQRGFEAQGAVNGISRDGGGGGGNGLAGGIIAGLGIPLTAAVVGSMIGKFIVSRMSEANEQLTTNADIAGIAPSNVSNILNDINSPALGGGDLMNRLQRIRSGNGQDVLNSLYALYATGVNGVSEEQLINTRALGQVGVSENQMGDLFRTSVRGGNADGISSDSQKAMFAEAVTVGMQGVRSGEFYDSITRIASATERTANKVDMNQVSSLMTSMAATGNQALMGDRGGNIAEQLTGSMLNPGGGVAGKLLMLRAAGFGKMTSKFGKPHIMNKFEAQMVLEQGVTPEFLSNMTGMLGGSNKEMSAMAFSAMTGIPAQASMSFFQDIMANKNGKQVDTGYTISSLNSKIARMQGNPKAMNALMGSVLGFDSGGKANTLDDYLSKGLGRTGGVEATSAPSLSDFMEGFKNIFRFEGNALLVTLANGGTNLEPSDTLQKATTAGSKNPRTGHVK
jgi:hypothetical protein